MAISAQRIEISIDELLLDGFPGCDKYRVGAALESALSRLISDKGMPASLLFNRNILSIAADAIQTDSLQGTSEAIGTRLASSVFNALRQSAAWRQ